MHATRMLSNEVVMGAPGEPAAPFAAIGRLMAEGGLEPTPAHYDLCYRYLAGKNAELVARVDAAIDRHGALTEAAAAELIERTPAAEEINGMIAAAHRSIEQIGTLLHRSDTHTQSYGAALQSNALRLVSGDTVAPVIEDLVTLTRTMIEHSRDVQTQLRETGEEVRQMRTRLDEARKTAITDPLTGLPNRRALDAELKTAMSKIRGIAAKFTLAICDIDHFKRFNDDHGHAVGDGVLKLVAARLGAAAGNGQIFVSRYGGEEFVMLFEGLDPEQAAKVVDGIRSDLAARDLSLSSSGRRLGRLSFSAGIAGFAGHRSASSVLKSADGALYEAKRLGRNQVCVA